MDKNNMWYNTTTTTARNPAVSLGELIFFPHMFSMMWIEPSENLPEEDSDNYNLMGMTGTETVELAVYSSKEQAQKALDDIFSNL